MAGGTRLIVGLRGGILGPWPQPPPLLSMGHAPARDFILQVDTQSSENSTQYLDYAKSHHLVRLMLGLYRYSLARLASHVVCRSGLCSASGQYTGDPIASRDRSCGSMTYMERSSSRSCAGSGILREFHELQ